MKKTMPIAFLALFLICGRALPDPDAEEPQRDAIALLQSDRPADAAWGAWLAGQSKLEAAEPLLLRLLLPHPDRISREWQFAHLAVVDALVVLGAKVPGEVLLPHARGRTVVPALILLSRDVARNRDALLTLFEHHGPNRGSLIWIAVGNLLAKGRASGFTAHVLGHLKMKLEITVTDSDNLFSGDGASSSIRFGDGRVKVPEGFPPTVVYRLYSEPRDGSEILADGPRPVYYMRTVRKESLFGSGGSSRSISGTECALEWLGLMLGVGREGIDVQEKSRARILWEGSDPYLLRATAARDAILDRYWSLVRRLFDKKLLTEAEAAKCAPSLTSKISDRRIDRSIALPEIPENKDRPTFSR